MSEPVLLKEVNDGMVTLTMNRPERKNALSRELRLALLRTFMDLAEDPDCRVVILTGAGSAFCAGLDLKELADSGGRSLSQPNDELLDEGIRKIWTFPRPLIGAVNGPAITGGFELALGCDILIASTEARFADTHARVGILPGSGLSQLLPRIIGPHRAKEVSLTGNFISAEKAYEWGIVNRVVPPESLLPEARAMARDIMSSFPEAVLKYKQLIDRGLTMTLEEGLKMELEASNASAAEAAKDVLKERRDAVISRGREQK